MKTNTTHSEDGDSQKFPNLDVHDKNRFNDYDPYTGCFQSLP